MTPNPILKVLSTFKKHNVKCLLIGGQACIVYGAAEFSRDSDFVVLSTPDNLRSLQQALECLKAKPIYVPELKPEYLDRGHACHFRCMDDETANLRVDIISRLRGCDPFDKLWERKNTVSLEGGGVIDVIGLRDIVRSKKTQRDKDWLMVRRLVENDIILHKGDFSDEQLGWWLLESRIPERLVDLCEKHTEAAKKHAINRPLLSSAMTGNLQELDLRLHEEELTERRKDVEYWAPLKKELELLRQKKQ